MMDNAKPDQYKECLAAAESRSIAPGDKFRHFKNKLYQIVAVAYHSETREKMVVYQALYGNFEVYVRPYDMFMSEVDRIKYPDVKQKYRFEKLSFCDSKNPAESSDKSETENSDQSEIRSSDKSETESITDHVSEDVPDGVNPYLLQFFDKKDTKDKIEFLNSIRNKVDDKLISDIAVSMDFTVEEGTIDERLNSLMHCLQMRARFECGRLR